MELEEQKILKRLSKAHENDNQEQIALQYNKLGDLRMNQGRYDEALDAFQESLSAYKQCGEPIQLGCAHRMVGEAYVQLGNWEKALKHQQIFLNLAKKANDKVEQQRAWASIGRAQLCLAESKGEEGEEQLRKEALSAAKNALMKSLAIATNDLNHLKKRDLVEMKARLMLNLGLIHEYQGQGNEALKKMEKAVELCEASELYEDLCRSLVALGSLKHRQGDCAAALNHIGQALIVVKRLASEEKNALKCDALVAQAEVFFTMGDFAAAKHTLHKAYKMNPTCQGVREAIDKNLKIAVSVLHIEKQLQEVEEDNFQQRKILYEQIADCASEVKAFNTAIDYYKKMLECSEALGEGGKDLSPSLVSLGLSYKDNKQYSEALYYLEREHELWERNPKEACRSLQEIASIYKLQCNGEQYLATLNEAHKQALLAENKTLQLGLLQEIANYHRSKGNSKAADMVENDMLDLRNNGTDSEALSSQEVVSSQEQAADAVWEHVNIENLSSDNSDSEDEVHLKSTRLRQRKQCKITKNMRGETALHLACIGGKIEKVRKLLEAHHPVNVRDNAGWTPLHEAANHGFRDIVELLIDYGANVDDKGGVECDGITPLHDAASNGYIDVMELLLDRGADVTAKTYKKPRKTPYDYFMIWHQESAPLSQDTEMNFELIKKRLHQAMDRAGFTFKETTDSQQIPSFVDTSSSLQVERPDSPIVTSQPSTSRQEKRHSYENRAIVNLAKGKVLRILSSGASSQSDDELSLRIGAMRRQNLSARKLNIDDDEEDVTPSVRKGPFPPTERRRAISSDSNGEDSVIISQQWPPRRGSSAREYADVMETIRGKHRTQSRGSEPFTERAKPALLHEEDMVEEWLEDDLKEAQQTQPTKRRRVLTPSLPRTLQSESRYERNSIIISSRTPSPDFDDMDADVEDVPPPSPPRRKVSPMKRSPIKASPIKRSPKKTSFSPQKAQRLIEKIELGTVKVRVNELLLLVPITSKDLTIEQLADEVAQRYYRQKGLLPKLTLLTKDGALLSPEDPVIVILNNKEEEIQARVDSMTLPPLIDRYREACQAQNQGADFHLLTCLESCQVTLSLQLNNLNLETRSDPLLTALTRQHSLRELSLSGCALGDAGMEKLCSVLETLEHISTLDLSCNNITVKGLTYMNNFVTSGNSLKTLKSLDFSHNPFEFEGLNLLGCILESLSSINKLIIRDCDFTLPANIPIENLPMFNLDTLNELDVSYNSLGSSGLGYFFGKLDVWQMSNLNVAFTTDKCKEDDTSAAREVALLVQNVVQGEMPGGLISHLDISGCNLSDIDVYELLRALSDAGIKVSKLSLSCNPNLSALSLRYILQHEPTISTLTLNGCPYILYPISASDLPANLASLSVSSTKTTDMDTLIAAWAHAKGTNSAHRCGPGGLLQLFTSGPTVS